jgi:hypothetical protein
MTFPLVAPLSFQLCPLYLYMYRSQLLLLTKHNNFNAQIGRVVNRVTRTVYVCVWCVCLLNPPSLVNSLIKVLTPSHALPYQITTMSMGGTTRVK